MSTAAAAGASVPRREDYIPGFDWVRLVGSIVVVMSHCGYYDLIKFNAASLYLLLNNVVPVFFLMAGYLIAEKLGDRHYVAGYIKKYALLYLALNLLRIALYAGNHLLIGHDFDLSKVLHALAVLPFNSTMLVPLWFIPALVWGVLVNALLYRRPKLLQLVCVLCLAVLLAHALAGYTTAYYPGRNIAKGILYVRLGVLRREKKTPLLPLILIAAALTVFELLVTYLDLAVIALSLVAFEFILRIKGQFLRPYHRQISVFSILTYFLHPLEQVLLGHFFSINRYAALPVILVGNALLTPLICRFLRKKTVKEAY